MACAAHAKKLGHPWKLEAVVRGMMTVRGSIPNDAGMSYGGPSIFVCGGIDVPFFFWQTAQSPVRIHMTKSREVGLENTARCNRNSLAGGQAMSPSLLRTLVADSGLMPKPSAGLG